MIFDNVSLQNDIIGSAMQASVIKNNVIQNNIANAEVPGFKKKTVVFDDALAKALNSSKVTKKLDLSSISPKVVPQHQNFSYRIDENNVDIEAEMALLYENSVKYDAMANSVISNYKKINTVLTR